LAPTKTFLVYVWFCSIYWCAIATFALFNHFLHQSRLCKRWEAPKPSGSLSVVIWQFWKSGVKKFVCSKNLLAFRFELKLSTIRSKRILHQWNLHQVILL
jgi:hypothetical protein